MNGAGVGGYFLGGKPPILASPYVQRGTIAITNGNSSATATVTSVDTANCALRYLGEDSPDSAALTGLSYVLLTNATTITGWRRSSTAGTSTISFEVSSYNAGVYRGNQNGVVSGTTASLTVTISAVLDITKTEMHHLGRSSDNAVGTQDEGRGAVTNTTTLTITRQGSGNTLYFAYQVMEPAS